MYQKILNEAIEELRENEFKELFDERTTDSMLQFVKDCNMETDLEVRIPDDYVNNVAERLSLYQEMDNLQDEEALEKFATTLIDRFGPLPRQVKELVLSFKLRWLAEELGIERLVIKSGKMVGYFLANPQSPFFETEAFQRLLQNAIKLGDKCRLAEQNGRLRIVFNSVSNIRDAFGQLERLRQDEK
jgi:transcription-repair coupling factor (superfamily II helicase)